MVNKHLQFFSCIEICDVWKDTSLPISHGIAYNLNIGNLVWIQCAHNAAPYFWNLVAPIFGGL